jgi:hypothetical protein
MGLCATARFTVRSLQQDLYFRFLSTAENRRFDDLAELLPGRATKRSWTS